MDGGMEVIDVMLIMLVGMEVSSGDKSSSADPKSFSSFSRSSSLDDTGCWPSCWASWIRRCLRIWSVNSRFLLEEKDAATNCARLSDRENALLQ